MLTIFSLHVEVANVIQIFLLGETLSNSQTLKVNCLDTLTTSSLCPKSFHRFIEKSQKPEIFL